MAEINENNGLNALVNKTKHLFGEVKETDVLEYEFDFLGSPSQIEYIEKGCGCTSAFFKDGKIKGTLDLKKANGSQAYPNGETAIEKFIFVWLNDGQPRFVADELKQKVQNPLKAYFKLSLNGSVVK